MLEIKHSFHRLFSLKATSIVSVTFFFANLLFTDLLLNSDMSTRAFKLSSLGGLGISV